MHNIFEQDNETVTRLPHCLSKEEQAKNKLIWQLTNVNPFDEGIVSWSSKRPTNGSYLIQISLFIDDWSSWLDYAYWGACDQYTFHSKADSIEVIQDTICLLNNRLATGIKIRILAQDKASLEGLDEIYISLIHQKSHQVNFTSVIEDLQIDLPLKGLSQMTIKSSLANRLCSPTSTIAVIHFLSGKNYPVLEFADRVIDSKFTIYGNWILNTAQASHILEDWHFAALHLNSFDQILEQLQKNLPVIISVKGPLKGSPLPYENGHLLVIKGFDAKSKKVFCMDPAFSTDLLTLTSYDLDDLLCAWNKRKGICYFAINKN